MNTSIAPESLDVLDGVLDVYVEGDQRYELWEDPERPFGCAPRDLDLAERDAGQVLDGALDMEVSGGERVHSRVHPGVKTDTLDLDPDLVL